MRTMKVFVLTKQGRDNQDQDTFEVMGVYSTKTAAKEKMAEEKERIKSFYADEYEGEHVEEYGENNIENWGIKVTDFPVFEELLITEKEVDHD